MKLLKPIWLIFVFAVFSANAAPVKQDAYARLDEFMRDMRGLQADFQQIVRDAQGRKVEESSGTLALSRPNRFRWDYREPHAQVIVADGEKLWLYDPDLEQVTVRALDQTLAGTPAMLLSGEGDLRDTFKIESAERRNGIEWFNLVPKRSDTDFKRVRLGLRDSTLTVMELTDKLGQTTQLEFSHVQKNPTFETNRFVFTPPQGADVIGAESGSR